MTDEQIKEQLELVFALPEGDHDAFELMDAVFEAGFEDAIVGTGVPGMIGISLEAASDRAEDAILDAARAIRKQLPAGSVLREILSIPNGEAVQGIVKVFPAPRSTKDI